MSGVERLRDVRRGELDNNSLLALARIVGVPQTQVGILTVFRTEELDEGYDGRREGLALDEEGDKVALDVRRLKESIFRELFPPSLG
jgi:hypothetical protein